MSVEPPIPSTKRPYVPPSSVKKRVITVGDLAELGQIPSVRKVEIFPHGTIRGNIISLGDKPAGQEAGILFYVRDKNYYDALREITPDLTLDQPAEDFEQISKKHARTFDKIYEQFMDKYEREKIHEFRDVQGKIYQQLFKEYEDYIKPYEHDALQLQRAKAYFKKRFLEVSLQQASSRLESVKKILSTSPDAALRELEESFNKNPILMGIYLDEIEKRNSSPAFPKDKAVTTYMLKLDYQGKPSPYLMRLVNTNTARKAGLKKYYKKLKAGIKQMKGLDRRQKESLLEELKKAKKEPLKVRAQRLRDILESRREILGSIQCDQLLAEADQLRRKAQLKSPRWKYFGKRLITTNRASAVRYRLGKALGLSWVSSPLSVSIDAVKEKLATQHAKQSGLDSQSIQTLEGQSLKDPTLPKRLLAAVWEKSFLTFEDMAGGEGEINGFRFPAIRFRGGKGSNPLSDSNYMSIRVSAGKQNVNVDVSASHLFPLGPQLAVFLVHLDRDAIGKAGQNKGVTIDSQGKVKLFGIDFGKSFQKSLSKLELRDDFTFKQPGSGDATNIVNMASFYDSSYVDRMQGVHLLAKQFGKVGLKQLGIEVSEQVRKDFASVWEDPAVKEGSHLEPFEKEIEHYNKLIKENEAAIKVFRKQLDDPAHKEARKQLKQEIAKLKALNKNYTEIVSEVEKMKQTMLNNYKTLLKTFSKRLCLTKDQLTLLDGLEKLSSDPTQCSADGEVLLHHLRVEREKRIPFQFLLNGEGHPKLEQGRYTILIGSEDEKKKREVFERIKKYAADPGFKKYMEKHNLKLQYSETRIAISFDPGQEKQLAAIFSEKNIARYLNLRSAGLSPDEVEGVLDEARKVQPTRVQPPKAQTELKTQSEAEITVTPAAPSKTPDSPARRKKPPPPEGSRSVKSSSSPFSSVTQPPLPLLRPSSVPVQSPSLHAKPSSYSDKPSSSSSAGIHVAASSQLMFSKPSSSTQASVQGPLISPLTEKHKQIIKTTIEKVGSKNNRYIYKEEGEGFSIRGSNPLAVIAAAQKEGFPSVAYTLTCKDEEEALRLLQLNKKEKNQVNVDKLIIGGKEETLEAFMQRKGESSERTPRTPGSKPKGV